MTKMVEPKAGDIWFVNFDPQVGREQGGLRPALVVSNDSFNLTGNGLSIVVPLTRTDRGIWYHIRISPPEGNVTKVSFIMCEQQKSQSDDRFVRKSGSVSQVRLEQVRDVIARFF